MSVTMTPKEELEYYKKMALSLDERLSHLLQSSFIRSFDEKDIKTGLYKKHISEADKDRTAPDPAPYCKYRTPCGLCEVYSMPGICEYSCKEDR